MTTDTLILSADTPLAVALARHELAAQLDGWKCGRMPDALLVFSELATNAVKHAGGAPQIRAIHGDQSLRFEVHDNSHDVPQVRGVPGPAGGFGLRLIAQICDGWGWETTATGKIVWAAVRCCGE
jgi:anti-sigma regulatory factor (Ser/Thr protein kinase)